MNDHYHSERARAYVREYVEQHTQLIQAWLEGGGTLEEVGAGFGAALGLNKIILCGSYLSNNHPRS